MREETIADGARELAERRSSPEPPIRHSPAAEHKVECHADEGLEQYQQQPALRGVGRAPKRDNDEHDEANHPLERDERDEKGVVLGRVERHRGAGLRRRYGRDDMNRIDPESALSVSTRSLPRSWCPETAASPFTNSASRVSEGHAMRVSAIGPIPSELPLRT